MTTEHKHNKLVNKAINGNQDAMSTLYSLYSKAMLNTAYRIVNNVADAEDILQDSFIKAFSNLHQFKFKANFGAWLKRIVINKSIDHIKKKNKLIFIEEKRDWIEIESSSEDANQPINTKAKLDQIYNALHQLPMGYRTVFSLFILEGYDHQEISEILDIGVSSSISQLSRAKKKLLLIMKNNNI